MQKDSHSGENTSVRMSHFDALLFSAETGLCVEDTIMRDGACLRVEE